MATLYRLPKRAPAPGETVIAPQAGPQTRFLACGADIVVYGGAAGGGKSYALLLDALRDAALRPVKGFAAVIFRREATQITQPGGLWDTSLELYPLAGGNPFQSPRYGWRWPEHHASVVFAHLQHETDKLAWQGSQIPWLGFDELTHFLESQFWYMVSRNRSPHGAKTRIRATTNPDPNSWVKAFLAPWVDPDYEGIKASSGEVLWMYRDGDAIVWYRRRGDAPEDVRNDLKSVTFIEAKLSDNPKLTEKDPKYRSNLLAMPAVEREMLLGGPLAWVIQPKGELFQPEWFPILDERPKGEQWEWVRYWDRAATKPSERNKDPDWTVGMLVGMDRDAGRYCIAHVVRFREGPMEVDRRINATARADGRGVAQVFEQEPGASGKTDVAIYLRELNGWVVEAVRPTGDKWTRAKPVASQAEAGNIWVVRGPWLHDLLSELGAFPNPRVHDDQVDTASGATAWLRDNPTPRMRFFDEDAAKADRAGFVAGAGRASLLPRIG
jgi:predicted phage terminase large subunit-like protein